MSNTAGEASRIRQQMQRVPSNVEEEGNKHGGDVVARSGTLFELHLLDCPICCNALTNPIYQCDNGHIACSGCCVELRNKCASCTLPIGKYRSSIMERVVESVVVPNPKLWGTLFDLDLLNCPICFNVLTTPIFQCDNGHIACSSCCTELRYQCSSCTLPIGNYRSRIMESVVEAIIVPCPNAKYGCTKKFSYGKELVHEKNCSFALCYCPVPNCNYTGFYKDLYSHYDANHKNTSRRFVCGHSHGVCLSISEKIFVLQEFRDGPLVVVQCFKEPQGMFVTVNCIAPSAPGVGEYSYDLSYTTPMRPKGNTYIDPKNTMTFKSEEMSRIQKVSFQTPENDFMLIPYYFLAQRTILKMSVCIRKLIKDEEVRRC